MTLKKTISGLLLAISLLIYSSAVFAQPDPDPNAVLPVEYLEVVTSNGSFKFSVEIADEQVERS